MKDTNLTIGIAGVRGSFSEEAAHEYARKHVLKNLDIENHVHADQLLTALEQKKIDLAIFAIENSNGGVVTEYLPAIASHVFHIEDIFEIPVRHTLLVQKGTIAKAIKNITSQDQALRQCRTYLKRVWPNVDVNEYIDTATAAKDLSEGKLSQDTAVIASGRCSSIYGLDILEDNIQDLKFNFTTFIAATNAKKTA